MSHNKPSANLLHDAESVNVSRREIVLLLILVLIGFSLRVWRLSEVGLDHMMRACTYSVLSALRTRANLCVCPSNR